MPTVGGIIRQPIVSVIGHVDHGKTTFLDKIRGTTIALRESGRITQHIGATEIPLDTIYNICGSLIHERKFRVPGLLFIDTPGHHSFRTLRARGGALADLAVLIIDIMEGFKPQTIESLDILRRYKTPFVVGANKIDLISGWEPQPDKSFIESYKAQYEGVQQILDEYIYKLVGEFYNHNFQAERYDKITDFQRTVAIIPLSAKTGEGIPDLLMVLIGLAQRFLETQLTTEFEREASGTVLEVKPERGLGMTIDTIIYAGTLKKGDRIVIGGISKPVGTKLRAILKPKPLDEIRDPRRRFKSVKEVRAAAGVKLVAPGLENVVAGSILKAIPAGKTEAEIAEEILAETRIEIETEAEGWVMIKADAIGSLEALAYELKTRGISVRTYGLGNISARDIAEIRAIDDKLRRVILGFNVKLLAEAKLELDKSDVEVIMGDVVYKLVEDYEAWYTKTKAELEAERRKILTYPCKIKLLEGYVFRVSSPAIVGVRVLAGKLKPDYQLMRQDGTVIGRVRSIQSHGEPLKVANAGDEVAVAIAGPTVGRQIKVNDILYAEINEAEVKQLLSTKVELTADEQDVLQELIIIKRKKEPFWGMMMS